MIKKTFQCSSIVVYVHVCTVIPSTSLALHLDPIEFRVAVKWWLGLDTSQGSQCAFCPAHSLDPLGHHALTCKCGGDVITRHNALRDTLAHFLHRAHASIEVEAGAGLFPDHSQSRPADILVKHWNHGRPVALGHLRCLTAKSFNFS